ncbi:MAG: hypothetical protein AAF626_14020 [Pseudomonadota bacterium]
MQNLYTIIRGKIDPTDSGGMMITEFEGGRALEVSADGEVVWEYVNRFDEAFTLEMTEARVYSVEEAVDFRETFERCLGSD